MLQCLLVNAQQKQRVREEVGTFFAGCLEHTPTCVVSKSGAKAPCNLLLMGTADRGLGWGFK